LGTGVDSHSARKRRRATGRRWSLNVPRPIVKQEIQEVTSRTFRARSGVLSGSDPMMRTKRRFRLWHRLRRVLPECSTLLLARDHGIARARGPQKLQNSYERAIMLTRSVGLILCIQSCQHRLAEGPPPRGACRALQHPKNLVRPARRRPYFDSSDAKGTRAARNNTGTHSDLLNSNSATGLGTSVCEIETKKAHITSSAPKNPAKAGAVSQRTKNMQAKTDAR
jgi:hypothetical protein